MKRLLTVFVMLALSSSAFAQWRVQVEDDGFDDKHYVASVMSKDGEAKMNLILYDGSVILDMETPEISYMKNYNKVEFTFKIKGENKTCEIGGCASRGASLLLLVPKNGGHNDLRKLFTDEFLSDFKNASLVKVKITYAVPYRGTTYDTYEEYVFNMTGSTNAYNRVSNQK